MMNEIDDNFEEYEAAEIRSGADFSQLTADNFDKIERDDDGTAFGVTGGVPFPLATEIYQQTENGITYDFERRQDGSEWFLGKTGEKRRGVSVSAGNVAGEQPGMTPDGSMTRDVQRGLAQGAFDAGKNFNETLPMLGAPVDLVNEGIGYVGDVFGLDLRSDYPIGGSESIRDGVEALVGFADFLMPDAVQQADIAFRAEKPESPIVQEIVKGITEFGVQSVGPAMYLKAFTAIGPFARGLAWGGISDFINAQPDDRTAIASLTEFLTDATPEERSAIAKATIDVFAQNGEHPDFINRAKVALDGMIIGGALEKGLELVVRASKQIPWSRLQEATVKAGARADERLASMARGTTLSANPINAAGDLALSAAGRVVAKQSDDGFEAYRKRVDPSGRTIPAEDRPNLRMGDMYGMLPKNAEVVGELDDVTLHRGGNGDYYATAYNPDVGEQDVVGYIQGRENGTELAVVEEMQGKGIGSELQYLFRSENPFAPTGGLTEAGASRLESTYDRLAAEEMIPLPARLDVEEYPNSLATMLYNVAEAPAKPEGARKWTKALLGRQMQEAAEKSGQAILKYDDAALDTLSTRMADEAVAALKKEGNASDWYNSKIAEMNNVLQKLHPELKSGTTEEGMFKAGLALTSNGATVDYNLKAAEHVYTVFKASGKFPEDLKSLEAAIGGFGPEGPTLVKQFARANDMITEMGADKFVEFLNTKFTVKELTQLGFKLSGEAVDFETYGSAIFGPKIGGGFYQNLRGNFNPVTFDRWWMASWGRWTGQPLLKTTGKARTDQLNRFRAASGKKYKDPQTAIAAAKKVYATYRKNNFQPRTELNQSAQRLAEGATDKMREQPAGPSERTFMRNVTYATVEKLKSMGYNLTPADLQATVWYPEKELHGFYGIGSGRSAPDDYAAAATRLLGERNAKR